MAKINYISAMLIIAVAISGYSKHAAINAQSGSCGDSCQTLDDCAGQLICINGACNDDPDLGTNICGGGGTGCAATSGNSDTCCSTNTCQTASCSPPITAGGTAGILTLNDFSAGGDGGDPSSCDGSYHNNDELVVALSTGWFDNRSRCSQSIVIYGNGRSVTATVVDECDSLNGCDSVHAYLPPCANNIVDGSSAVWEALQVSSSDSRYGYMEITWEDA